MPIFQFEAMDKTGQEVRDVIEAANQEEAQEIGRACVGKEKLEVGS
jgi:hypothetical protein